ncbi:MAG: vWA domain-containing protein, partial [Gemmataceae bacterium]
MLEVRRLIMAGAVVAIAIVISCASVWGDPRGDQAAREKERERRAWLRGEEIIRPVLEDNTAVVEDTSKNRFVDLPVITYTQPSGDQLIALQVQPKLPDAPIRPTDYLVVVDTSASKAMGHLSAAVQMVEELRKLLKEEDRLAIWTANITPKDLSRGFKSAKELDAAMKELHAELPLGAVDLEKSLTTALESFEPKQSRYRAVIFFGDGKSVANPLGSEEREKLVKLLAKKQAAFFPVPMGVTMDPANLHGLSIGSGGKTVRHGAREKPAELVARLLKEIAEPILQPSQFTLPVELSEIVPSVLPPLRRDQATLVVAKVKAGTKMPETINWKLRGEVAGEVVHAEATLKVPAAEDDHFFLAGMYDQWRAKKTEPAMLPADRALGFAYKQNQLALEDVLAKGDTALENDNLDAARKLYLKAMEFAPHSQQAQAGLKLIDKMRSGKKTRAQVLAELRLNGVKRTLIRYENGERKVVVLADGDEKPEEPKEDPADRALADVKARKEIARQQAEQMVAETIRQANRIVTVDPDQANLMLKQALDGLKGNTDLEPKDINELSTRLVRSLETINRIGAQRKRDAAEAAALRAAADARLDVRRTEILAQERVRERMRVFHNLMDQARELEAERQAEAIRQDLVNQGMIVPPAVSAAYRIGQAAYHLREQRDMRRIREDRFLAVLLEVDRSHVPFPDEPAI